jgi:hypothetical protein
VVDGRLAGEAVQDQQLLGVGDIVEECRDPSTRSRDAPTISSWSWSRVAGRCSRAAR